MYHLSVLIPHCRLPQPGLLQRHLSMSVAASARRVCLAQAPAQQTESTGNSRWPSLRWHVRLRPSARACSWPWSGDLSPARSRSGLRVASGGASARRSSLPPAANQVVPDDFAVDTFTGQSDAGWFMFKVDPFDSVYLAGFLVPPTPPQVQAVGMRPGNSAGDATPHHQSDLGVPMRPASAKPPRCDCIQSGSGGTRRSWESRSIRPDVARARDEDWRPLPRHHSRERLQAPTS